MKIHYLNSAATFALLVLGVYILFIGRSLLLPLVIALVLWYIIMCITRLYQRIPLRGHMRYGIALFLAIITTAIFVYLFSLMLTNSISSFIETAPAYQNKLQEVLDWINNLAGTRLHLAQFTEQIDLKKLFLELPFILSLTVTNFILVIIYLCFLILEHRSFNQKIKAMCKSSIQYNKAKGLMEKISEDVNNYLKVKTAISFITGLLSYFVLLGFGIHNAEFWATFIFLLNYIPYIGPLIAVVTVLLAASIQTNPITFVILGLLLMSIQIAIGNFLEPKWLGMRLNLSPLVILLSLAFWGAVWGIIGLFLSVPMMVIINIILAKFPRSRPIAIMLSETGEVDSD